MSEQGGRLLIMRHGDAQLYAASDAQRSLSDRGRAEADSAGRNLAALGGRPVVYHSPYLRARQTADLVLGHIDIASREQHSGLTPDSDPRAACRLLQRGDSPLVLCVAHQPLVGRLASWLVDGDSTTGRGFATAAIALLRYDFPGPGGATLVWYREPADWP